jgi:hypothetical protein
MSRYVEIVLLVISPLLQECLNAVHAMRVIISRYLDSNFVQSVRKVLPSHRLLKRAVSSVFPEDLQMHLLKLFVRNVLKEELHSSGRPNHAICACLDTIKANRDSRFVCRVLLEIIASFTSSRFVPLAIVERFRLEKELRFARPVHLENTRIRLAKAFVSCALLALRTKKSRLQFAWIARQANSRTKQVLSHVILVTQVAFKTLPNVRFVAIVLLDFSVVYKPILV